MDTIGLILIIIFFIIILFCIICCLCSKNIRQHICNCAPSASIAPHENIDL